MGRSRKRVGSIQRKNNRGKHYILHQKILEPEIVQNEEEKNTIYNINELEDNGEGYKCPPKFMYTPSRNLVRVQILRACYIKNIEQFLKPPAHEEFKLSLDDVKI